MRAFSIVGEFGRMEEHFSNMLKAKNNIYVNRDNSKAVSAHLEAGKYRVVQNLVVKVTKKKP